MFKGPLKWKVYLPFYFTKRLFVSCSAQNCYFNNSIMLLYQGIKSHSLVMSCCDICSGGLLSSCVFRSHLIKPKSGDSTFHQQ